MSGEANEDKRMSTGVGQPRRSPVASARTALGTSNILPSESVFRKSRVASTAANEDMISFVA
jgi:hypothetical protein